VIGEELRPGLRRWTAWHWLADARALVPGDAILGAGGGGLTLCPASWVGGEDKLAKLRETLRPLLDLPIQIVLVSHGEPVLRGGARALGRALA